MQAVVRVTIDRKTGQRLQEEIVGYEEVNEDAFFRPLVEMYGKQILEALQSQPEGLGESGDKTEEEMTTGSRTRQKRMTIAENMRKGGKTMLSKTMLRMFKKQKMPMPVNLNDCMLLWQMGYAIVIHDGRVVAIVKEGKKRDKNVERNFRYA